MTLENLQKKLIYIKDPSKLKIIEAKIEERLMLPKYAHLIPAPKKEKVIKSK